VETNPKRWRAERGTPVEEKATTAESPVWEWEAAEEDLARGRREVRLRRSMRLTVMAGRGAGISSYRVSLRGDGLWREWRGRGGANGKEEDFFRRGRRTLLLTCGP
jgi:hypothetical protein